MKLSIRKLRQLIRESLEKRIAFANDMIKIGLTPEEAEKKGILNINRFGTQGEDELKPQGKFLFHDQKAIYKDRPVEKVGKYMGKPYKYIEDEEELFMGAMEAIRAATKRGKIMKQLFRQYADPNFMNQLILIHYASPDEVLKNIKAPKGNYELSSVGLLPVDFVKNKIQVLKTAMILDGHVTYFANNQDDIYSGKGSNYVRAFSPQKGYEPWIEGNPSLMDWEDEAIERGKGEKPYAGSDRTKSSGVNKSVMNIRGVERFKSPSMSRSNYLQSPGFEHFEQAPDAPRGVPQTSRGEPPVVLDKEDYLPRFDHKIGSDSAVPGNEALVDNWSVKAIILNWGAENEKYEKMFRDAGYQGKIMTFDEAIAQKASLINKGHKR
jgi:hypothetical protein